VPEGDIEPPRPTEAAIVKVIGLKVASIV